MSKSISSKADGGRSAISGTLPGSRTIAPVDPELDCPLFATGPGAGVVEGAGDGLGAGDGEGLGAGTGAGSPKPGGKSDSGEF
ncbi:hypothetical protein [Parasphingorhabdus halotolerans]|uniref:Uncharacterized protein n=1 Tax=Parasphingorhabdus halotolerans TaxID=2725558 RepID=A0A6H2DL61_9SPHN|nr:hypothetical protein [Parasphingorhabdus halotolerans]QJB68938.1 hypothetical protein HF685_06320 [Parasphingorhabdus halotolerans]